MAIVEIKELFEADGSWTLGPENKRTRNYSRKFLVRCDSVTDSPIDIMLNTGLPQLGQYYKVGSSYDQVSVVTNVTPKREKDNAKHWRVDCKYEILDSKEGKQPPQQNPNNPTDPRNWTPEITTNWVKFQVPTYIDINGNPIVNSCGDLFNPPVNVDDDRLQIKISRYEQWLDVQKCLKYKNTINSDNFWGCPPGCWKLLPIAKSQEIINDPQTGSNWIFFKTHYTLELNVNGWGARPVDRGLNRLANKNVDGTLTIPAPSYPDNPVRVPITTPFGTNHTTPQLLDGHGQPLALGATPVWVAFAKAAPPPNGARMAGGYQVYKALPFNPLNLPPMDAGILANPVAGAGGALGQGVGGGGSYY